MCKILAKLMLFSTASRQLKFAYRLINTENNSCLVLSVRFAGGRRGWTPLLFFDPPGSSFWLTPGGVGLTPSHLLSVIPYTRRLNTNPYQWIDMGLYCRRDNNLYLADYVSTNVFFKGFRHLIILQKNLALLGHRTFAYYIAWVLPRTSRCVAGLVTFCRRFVDP